MMPRLPRSRTLGRTPVIVLTLAATSAAVFGMVRYSHHAPQVPTYQVKRDEFRDVLQFRGELKAMKSITLAAPADAGNLQIIKLAADGSQVKKGDVIVEFDRSKNKHTLAQDQSVQKSTQAEIEQAKAHARLTEEEDTTAVLKARYDVEVAKLDASKGEILSRIEGGEANLKLADAQQKLHEAEEKLRSDQGIDSATIEDKVHSSTKADYDAKDAALALANMTLIAPQAGTVSLIPVWHTGGEGPFKAGEPVWPGAPIAELPDASSLRINARVDETERGRLDLKQPVTAQLDAIADRQFTGRIEEISTIATSDFSAGWPIPRNFNLQIAFDRSDPQLRPGMTVQVTVIVERIPNAITIPAEASFLESGQTIAYVWNGAKFQKRTIQVERRSRDRILISAGLQPGDLVALKDPTEKE
jgi:HlyD family secretion protein